MMRRLLIVLALAVTPAFGATYHVKETSTCSNHGTVLGGSCISTTGCGAVGTPCCTLDDAEAISGLAAGDTIYLHEETDTRTGGLTWNVAGVSIETQDSDAHIWDLNSTSESGFRIQANYVSVIGDWTITGNSDDGSDSTRIGCFDVSNDVKGVHINGTTCERTADDSGGSISSMVGYSIDTVEGGILLENCSVTGVFNTGLYIETMMKDDTDDGIVVRDCSVVAGANAAEFTTGVIFENIGSDDTSTDGLTTNDDEFAFYNNYINLSANTYSGTESRGMYLRTGGAKMYLFNNRVYAKGYGLYFQNNEPKTPSGGSSPGCCTWDAEQHQIFNNTFAADGGGIGVHWPGCVGGDLDFVNNVWDDWDSALKFAISCDIIGGCPAAGCPTCNTTCNTSTNRTAADSMTSWIAFSANQNICAGNGGGCVDGNWSTWAAASFTDEPTGDGPASTSDPNLDTDLSIASSGSSVDAGDNDPLGQGADTCSLTISAGNENCATTCAVASNTIDCSVDYEGDNRGSMWDIGADEFVVAGPADPRAGSPRRVIISQNTPVWEWDAVAGAAYYNWRWSFHPTEWPACQRIQTTETWIDDSDLWSFLPDQRGSLTHFVVTAVNAGGESPTGHGAIVSCPWEACQ